MDIRYKAPSSKVEDLNYQPIPLVLKPLYWLMGLALACSLSSMTIGLIWALLDLNWFAVFDWSQQLIFAALAFSIYGVIFVFYYFLVFRPLQKRKRSTSKRWLIAVLILASLSSVSLSPRNGEESEIALIETVLGVLELVFLTIGAILAASL
mgnify:CR=1 FL=1